MKIKTNIKAGKYIDNGCTNHNQTVVRRQPKASLKVKTHLKAGKLISDR